MPQSKKDTKRVVNILNSWNKPRFTDEEEFCRASVKVNKKKVHSFAAVMSDDLFRPLVDMLGENSSRPLVAMTVRREQTGKLLHLAYTAEKNFKEIDAADSNEMLFGVQNRLREICAAVVELSVSIINMEGTPFARSKQTGEK